MLDIFASLIAVCSNIKPMQWILSFVIIVIVGFVFKWSQDKQYKNFSLVNMMVNKDGFPDDHRIQKWGAFLLSSYGFLWLLWADKLSEWYFVAYMAVWAGAELYAMKKRCETPAPAG